MEIPLEQNQFNQIVRSLTHVYIERSCGIASFTYTFKKNRSPMPHNVALRLETMTFILTCIFHDPH